MARVCAVLAWTLMFGTTAAMAQNIPPQYQIPSVKPPESGSVQFPQAPPPPPAYDPKPGVPLGKGVYGTGSIETNNGNVTGATGGVIVPHDVGGK